MKLSIIIPVYNAEKFLDRCLKSVVEAVEVADKSVEILLIDNNSTDNSLNIIKEWEKKIANVQGNVRDNVHNSVRNSVQDSVRNDVRDNVHTMPKKTAENRQNLYINLHIKILECHTWGAAAVRNYGVKKARGEYVWFIDADDTIAPDSIALLLAEAEGLETDSIEAGGEKTTRVEIEGENTEKTKADIVMMGATRIYSDGRTDELTAVLPSEADYKSRFVRYGAGPWQFIFRREWWNTHKFSFREGIIHEDMEMISALIIYTERFTAVDKPLYRYYQNAESVLHKDKWDPHYLDIFPALTGLYNRFKEVEAVSKYHDELEWFFVWNLLIDSSKDFAKFPEGKVGFLQAREMMKKYFPKWRENKFLKQKPLKLRIKVRLNYYK